jgi:hypothetical protein
MEGRGMRIRNIFALLCAFILAPIDARAAEQADTGTRQYMQIQFYTPAAGREFNETERLVAKGGHFYAPVDWALRLFNLPWTIDAENKLVIARTRAELPVTHGGTVAKGAPAITFAGAAFTDVLPGEPGPQQNSPLQLYVELKTFTEAALGGYFYNEQTQVIHLSPVSPAQMSSPTKKSICEETIEATKTRKTAWPARFRPACNVQNELVSGATGRAIVFFGHRCQGGAVHADTEEERKAWQDENADLRSRYEVVDEVSCPCCIP